MSIAATIGVYLIIAMAIFAVYPPAALVFLASSAVVSVV